MWCEHLRGVVKFHTLTDSAWNLMHFFFEIWTENFIHFLDTDISIRINYGITSWYKDNNNHLLYMVKEPLTIYDISNKINETENREWTYVMWITYLLVEWSSFCNDINGLKKQILRQTFLSIQRTVIKNIKIFCGKLVKKI